MSALRDAAQKALEALETVLSDAYHRRFPECCGRPGSECCGNPNEAWAPEDTKIMDALSPAHRQLSDALRAALAEQPAGPDAEPAIPPGYKLVPVEPTPAMLVAINWPNDPAGYRAMLAAAPEAPQPAKPAEQEPVEIEMPEYHSHGMGCGLEDRGITDRYQAMEYGWYEAIDRVKEELANFGPLYTAPQPAIPPGWATAYAAFKGAFDTPLARRRDSGEYAQDARRLLREFNDAMLAAPEAPQPAIPPGYKLVPIQKLTANTDDKHDEWRFGDGEDSTSGPKDCAVAIRQLKDKT